MASSSQLRTDEFTEFVKDAESGLQRALVARYGIQVGGEAAAEALAYAWEHWDRVEKMANPVGYLYRVGCTRSRRFRQSQLLFPETAISSAAWVEPELPSALGKLSNNQRIAVLLVHSFEYTHSEAADLMDIAAGTLRKHLERGMRRLRDKLEVDDED